MVADTAEQRLLPRTLAGATVLQIVPALHDAPQVRTTISTAHALVQVGARVIVAGERGELVDELKSFGGEWLPFANATMNLTKLRANAETLDKFIATEGVAIVHAKSAGAAWSASIATKRNGIHLVTDLPDLPQRRMWLASFYLGSLSRGDRLISHSLFNARPMMKRHRIPPERISVVPRSIDLRYFNRRMCRPNGSPSSVRSGAFRTASASCWCPDGSRLATVIWCWPRRRAFSPTAACGM